MSQTKARLRAARGVIAVTLAITVTSLSEAQSVPPNQCAKCPHDPGVRGGTVDAGNPFSTLTSSELAFFNDGLNRFQTTETVSTGLGPTFNATSCATCHSQPATGGTSPAQNPQIAQAPSSNTIPSFLSASGPVLEARFPFFLNSNGTLSSVADGSVHDLFTITGLAGSGSCNISQPNFAQMQQLNNIIFRIPTPVFGLGLIETITEETIIANMNANASQKSSLGIHGVPNRSGNDGTITRFGWKAQNKSGQMFAGEAYNVEMGITNELFPNERGNSSTQNASNDPPTTCLLNALPEDATNFTQSGTQIPSDIVEFSHFMRFLKPPAQDINGIPGNPSAATIANGKATFETLGCNMCHTESLTTGSSSYDTGTNQTTAFLSNQTANLYSDLLIHHMGGLADGITQGLAGGDQFRTAPLWGLGQRIFFLHDGRATPANGGLVEAIYDHDLPPPSGVATSEAHDVITNFSNYANGTVTQLEDLDDMLDFLRSL
jgi:CxxC motif-containing protein (DUF1111 family)